MEPIWGRPGRMINSDDKTQTTEEVNDEGNIGAEGGDTPAKDRLPAAPDTDADDTPLGDTDQHSEVPPPPMKH